MLIFDNDKIYFKDLNQFENKTFKVEADEAEQLQRMTNLSVADAAARLPTRQVAAWAQCLMQARPQIREWTQARIWAWAKAAAAATGNGTATGAATAP